MNSVCTVTGPSLDSKKCVADRRADCASANARRNESVRHIGDRAIHRHRQPAAFCPQCLRLARQGRKSLVKAALQFGRRNALVRESRLFDEGVPPRERQGIGKTKAVLIGGHVFHKADRIWVEDIMIRLYFGASEHLPKPIAIHAIVDGGTCVDDIPSVNRPGRRLYREAVARGRNRCRSDPRRQLDTLRIGNQLQRIFVKIYRPQTLIKHVAVAGLHYRVFLGGEAPGIPAAGYKVLEAMLLGVPETPRPVVRVIGPWLYDERPCGAPVSSKHAREGKTRAAAADHE